MADKDLRHLLENLFSDLPIEEIQPPTEHEEREVEPMDGLLASALSAITDAVIITDADGVILFSNPASERITGYDPEEIIGLGPDALWESQHPDAPYREMWQSLRSGQAWSGKLPNLQNDGTVLAVEIRSTAIQHADQKVLVHVARDSRESEPVKTERLEPLKAVERRNTLLQAMTHVSQAVSSTLDLDDLLPQVVNLINKHMDLYFTGVFLVDETGERSGEPSRWAILRAGTGSAGAEMLSAGHRFEIGGASMVGWCIANHEARISPRAGDKAIRFTNPLLPETRSEMAIPLSSHGRLFGALTLQDTREAAFSQDDVAIIQTMADQLANAIENARLFRHSTRQITELEVVSRVSQAIASVLKLDDLMRAVYQQVSRLFDTANFYIATYHEGSDQWHSEFHIEAGQRQDAAWYSIESGLTGHIIRSRAPLLFRSEQEITSFHEERGTPFIGDAALSWLGVPLISGEEVVGVMAIQDYSQEYLYSEQDLALFDTIASQVAVALDSLRLLQQTERRAQELEVINQVGGAITSVLDLDAVLFQISDAIKTQFGYYFVGVSLLEDDRLIFHGGSTIGESKSRLDLPSFGLSDGPSLITTVAQTGEPVVVDDVLEDPTYLPVALLPETRSELDLPIKVKGQVIGILDVQSSQPRAFSPTDIALLQSIANQAGVAIDNARLYEQSQSARAQAEELYRVSAALSAVQDFKEVLSVLCDNSLLAHAQEVTVSLFDRPWTEDQTPRWCEAVARRGAVSTEPGIDRRSIDTFSWIAQHLDTSSPIIIENLQTDPRVDPESRARLIHSSNFLGAILIPIVVGGQRIGIVEGYFSEPISYPSSPLRRLTALVDQAAVSIQGIRQYEEIERRASREQALRQIAETVGSAEDLEECLPAVAQILRSLVTLDLFELSTCASGDPEFRRYSFDPIDGRSSINWIPATGSLTAWVTAEGRPRMDSDLRLDKLFVEDEDWIAAGLVSRVTIPLQVRDLSLGNLSLLSRQPSAYSEQEMPTLRQVSDLIALALERARLLDNTRAALSRAEAGYRRYLSDEWKGYLSATPQGQGYLASHDVLTEQSDIWTPEIERALDEGTTVIWQEATENQQSSRSAIALPIRLGGHTIGVLDFYQEGQEREWSDDERALVEALADQIALALENARLYQEAERRAQREATIGQIVTQVRQQPDIDAILRTAVREVGKALGTSRTFVRLSSPVEATREPGEVARRGEP